MLLLDSDAGRKLLVTATIGERLCSLSTARRCVSTPPPGAPSSVSSSITATRMEATAGVRRRTVATHGVSTRSEHDSALTTMHPITGTFADPERESSFAVHCFRLAFPFHAFLMALFIPLTVWAAKGAPSELQPKWYTRSLLCSISLIGRVLTHRIEDPVRSQRVGAWCWTALVLLSCCVLDMHSFWRIPAIACGQAAREVAAIPLIYLGAALTNGSHGLGFEHKTALIGLVLAVDIFGPVAACDSFLRLIPLIFIMAAGVTGFVLAHMAELMWRHSISSTHAEMERLAEGQRSLEEKLDDETRRLEERNEQLRAEKERLLYDNALQRRGRHFDDNDDRSAIGRGLQAEPSQPYLPADDGTASMSESSDSQAGPHRPSGSPPVSLPPGPPSTATKSSKSSCKSVGTSSALELELDRFADTYGSDALLTDFLGDRELSDLLTHHLSRATDESTGRLDDRGPGLGQGPSHRSQGSVPSVPNLLRPRPLVSSLLPTAAQQRVQMQQRHLPPPAQTHSGVVASVAVAHQQRVIPNTMQDTVAVDSTLQGQGNTRQGVAPDLPAGPSCNVHEPPVSLEGQSSNMSSTQQQQALHVARDRIKAARSDLEVYRVVRTLAIALGASRTEGGTITALHAVLLQLERPGLSCDEARASTGASVSNFKKWQRRVHQARLNLPLKSRVNSDARKRAL